MPRFDEFRYGVCSVNSCFHVILLEARHILEIYWEFRPPVRASICCSNEFSLNITYERGSTQMCGIGSHQATSTHENAQMEDSYKCERIMDTGRRASMSRTNALTPRPSHDGPGLKATLESRSIHGGTHFVISSSDSSITA